MKQRHRVKISKMPINMWLLTIMIVSTAYLTACRKDELKKYEDGQIENIINEFYESDSISGIVEYDATDTNKKIEGFCVLSAYESRVTSEGELIIPANAFLQAIELKGEEDHWHLIINTSSGLRLARFETNRTPLITPRPSFNGTNCVRTKNITLIKKEIPTGGMPLLGGKTTKIVLDLQKGE